MKVYFIGAGSGDPELLTIKGKKILEKADTIIYAGSLVNPDILKYASDDAEIYNSAGLSLDKVLEIMEESIDNNRLVARVHTGDPSIYGAIKEQIDYLKKKSIDFDIIPGVSSFTAAAAAVESEFTLPDVSQTVIITRLEGRTPVPEKEKLKDLAQHQASMAIFLSVHMIERVVNELKEAYGPDTAVAVVSKASWPDEEVVKGTLNDIALKVKEAGIKKTSMILVGDFLDGDYSYSKLYDKNFSHAYRKGEGENMKAILVVSFGTSYHETRKVTIEACEQAIADKFSDYELRRAFTSNMIIKKMKERDKIYVDTPIEALKKLKEEGFSEVIIQPLHIIPGSEYHDLYMEAQNYKDYFEKLEIGRPLLYEIDDYFKVAEALKSQLPSLEEREAVVFMGHGTEHPANSAYANLDYVFKDLGMNNVHMATVEGYPELENVIRKLKANNSEKVALMPFMLVAGDHAQNDMASDDKDSWKSILKEEGFEVETYLHGIGENKEMQKLYIGKVNELINN